MVNLSPPYIPIHSIKIYLENNCLHKFSLKKLALFFLLQIDNLKKYEKLNIFIYKYFRAIQNGMNGLNINVEILLNVLLL